MTRVALIEPQSSGGNWWAIVETGWTKHEGPKAPRLTIPWMRPEPVVFHAEYVPPAPIENIEVQFGKITNGTGRGIWIAQVEGSSEATCLLNIAYTCPDTHVHWREAKHLRDRFEGALLRSS